MEGQPSQPRGHRRIVVQQCKEQDGCNEVTLRFTIESMRRAFFLRRSHALLWRHLSSRVQREAEHGDENTRDILHCRRRVKEDEPSDEH